MPGPADPGGLEPAEALAREAARAAADAVADISRSLTPATGTTQIPAPDTPLRIARQLEHAARGEVRTHIRRARGAGISWHKIGALLGFGAFATDGGTTVAEWAFDYTTGPRTANGWFDAPVFTWHCSGCGQPVSDRGPGSGPRYDETGHGDSCPLLAAAAAEWNADRPGTD